MIERLTNFLAARRVDLNTFGVIFDIGSRDGLQALELGGLFPAADIVAIECNQDTVPICRRNLAQNSRIQLVEKAVNSYTGRCSFYPIDPTKTITTWPDGNPGASSLFVATGDYPPEKYVQNRVEVDCIRLDDLCAELKIDAIDLIWMDLQGAELLALQSAGDLLDKVRYVYTEISHKALYSGQCLFDDIDSYLIAHGFRRCTKINRERWQQDIIYENTRDLIDVVIPVAHRDQETVDLPVRAVRRHVKNVRQIYVVSAQNPNIEGVKFIGENTFPFNIDDVRKILDAGERTGWYLQQLIKLYFPLVHRGCLEHVLAVDADTLFLQPCEFMQDGRTIFNFGDGYHIPYFDQMRRLIPALDRMFCYSGITYCTLFKRAWLNELHAAVGEHHPAMPFWRSYLEAVDPADYEHGASESEVYFNFCLILHADEIVIRRFRWRNAAAIDDIPPVGQDYVCLHRRLRKTPIDRRWLEQRVHPDAVG